MDKKKINQLTSSDRPFSLIDWIYSTNIAHLAQLEQIKKLSGSDIAGTYIIFFKRFNEGFKKEIGEDSSKEKLTKFIASLKYNEEIVEVVDNHIRLLFELFILHKILGEVMNAYYQEDHKRKEINVLLMIFLINEEFLVFIKNFLESKTEKVYLQKDKGKGYTSYSDPEGIEQLKQRYKKIVGIEEHFHKMNQPENLFPKKVESDKLIEKTLRFDSEAFAKIIFPYLYDTIILKTPSKRYQRVLFFIAISMVLPNFKSETQWEEDDESDTGTYMKYMDDKVRTYMGDRKPVSSLSSLIVNFQFIIPKS